MNSPLFPGFPMSLGNLYQLSNARSRSISAENVYGEKARGGMADLTESPQPEVEKIGQKWNGPNPCARELGKKWKVRPCITLEPKKETTLMDVGDSGVIQHIWITVHNKNWRRLILRMYWDDQDLPSVETPLGDFFCNGWHGKKTNINSLPINVNPTGGFNSFFPMPFSKRARMTIENLADEEVPGFYYTINYILTEVGKGDARFHAQFRRTNPLPYKQDYTILDGVRGRGHFVGCNMSWQQNNCNWWGEGEIKIFLDGDGEYPTICVTGTEDYFGGAWGFQDNYSAPFMGYPLGKEQNGERHTLYRFHVMDPVRFQQDIRITMQALGWRSDHRYLPLQDDISSVAYWYQELPTVPFPPLPDKDGLEVI